MIIFARDGLAATYKGENLPKICSCLDGVVSLCALDKKEPNSLCRLSITVKYEKRNKTTFALQTSDALLPTPIHRSQ